MCAEQNECTRKKSKIFRSVRYVERERISRCVADLLQLSHFGTRVCASRKKREEGASLRVSPDSPTHFQQQTAVFRGGRRRGQKKKKKRRRGPFKSHSTFSKIPSCTRSSLKLSTYLAKSLLLHWVRQAGGANEPFHWLCAHGPSVSYWFPRPPLDAVSRPFVPSCYVE